MEEEGTNQGEDEEKDSDFEEQEGKIRKKKVMEKKNKSKA